MRDLITVVASIDAVNAEDPRLLDGRPLALVQGERCWSWVETICPKAADALLIAARAHHLRRWDLPRTHYPQGRPGYLSWRREQKHRHAAHLRTLLNNHSYDHATADRAVEIIQKNGLGTDPEVQTFEDAVCLTFLETEFSTTADRIDDQQKMASVVAKTLRKMSSEGRALAMSIPLSERETAIVSASLQCP